MSSSLERYKPTVPFELPDSRTGDHVGLVMEHGLVAMVRDERVVAILDERGPGLLYASPDERFSVEVRPIGDSEFAPEADIRARLLKRGEWFKGPVRVFMTTKRDLPYWDNETGATNTTQIVTVLTFDIPTGLDQPCRLVGVAATFQDAQGQPDPHREEIFLGGMKSPNQLDEYVTYCAAEQVLDSYSG